MRIILWKQFALRTLTRPRRCEIAEDVSPRLLKLVQRSMSEFPHLRPTVEEFSESLRSWVRFASLEKRAMVSLAAARESYRKARSFDKNEWDEAYIHYITALADYENVLKLSPEFTEGELELKQALSDFASAALSVGNIFLARMLKAGHRPPQSMASLQCRRVMTNTSRAISHRQNPCGRLIRDEHASLKPGILSMILKKVTSSRSPFLVNYPYKVRVYSTGSNHMY